MLLFASPYSQKARTHHTIQVSFDDGRTWPPERHLLLDEGRGAGYPSLTRVDDAHVGIVYEGSQAWQETQPNGWLVRRRDGTDYRFAGPKDGAAGLLPGRAVFR